MIYTTPDIGGTFPTRRLAEILRGFFIVLFGNYGNNK